MDRIELLQSLSISSPQIFQHKAQALLSKVNGFVLQNDHLLMLEIEDQSRIRVHVADVVLFRAANEMTVAEDHLVHNGRLLRWSSQH